MRQYQPPNIHTLDTRVQSVSVQCVVRHLGRRSNV